MYCSDPTPSDDAPSDAPANAPICGLRIYVGSLSLTVGDICLLSFDRPEPHRWCQRRSKRQLGATVRRGGAWSSWLHTDCMFKAASFVTGINNKHKLERPLTYVRHWVRQPVEKNITDRRSRLSTMPINRLKICRKCVRLISDSTHLKFVGTSLSDAFKNAHSREARIGL